MTEIRSLLQKEPERLQAMLAHGAHWRLDVSRIPVALESWRARMTDSAMAPLRQAVEVLFGGALVNPSERQPALHMALRAAQPASLCPDSDAAVVQASRDALLAQAGALYRGETPVRTLLHAGIGGSDLGPRLVTEALDPDDSAIRVEWLTTLDARRIRRLLARLDPATTGLVIASKSFSTVETLTQARWIREWLGPEPQSRIWAATANPERARSFGVAPDRVLGFPGWTGGRYSLWSSVGFSAAARLGPTIWQALLVGAAGADRQVRESLADSPALALARAADALVREHGMGTLGVVSYAPELRLLSEFLQQLVMESLGKAVDLDNAPVLGSTSPLVFGGAGTDLQHSLFQALHQGTTRHPMLLVGSCEPVVGLEDWQREQLAHLLGQASALVNGRETECPEQRLPGNNPVMTLLAPRVDAGAVGELIAQFEHAVYLLSALWRINAFDQWGVEEGKRLAGEFRSALAGERECPDDSLNALFDWIRAHG